MIWIQLVENGVDDLHFEIELVVGINFIRDIDIDKYILRGWKVLG
jgi:hypothetical protein